MNDHCLEGLNFTKNLSKPHQNSILFRLFLSFFSLVITVKWWPYQSDAQMTIVTVLI